MDAEAAAAEAIPLWRPAAAVRLWFDTAMRAAVPTGDGTLATARTTAKVAAQHAKTENTRRAYRAGIRAWCTFCAEHDLCPLPADPADIAAFLSAERYPLPPRKPLSPATLRLRLAAIACLHYVAGLPCPTATAQVTETFAGLTKLAQDAGDGPRPKLALKIDLLREILAPIGDDFVGLRDRALLLLGFAGAFRRAELARIEVAHIERCEQGLRIRLPRTKGDREGKGVEVGIPYGQSELCPVRALDRWLAAAEISEGALFRRIRTVPRRGVVSPGEPKIRLVLGSTTLDSGSIARIIQSRGAAIGLDRGGLGGHSLKRGALNTAKDRRVHPSRLKQLARHKSYSALAAYIEEGDPFEDNALTGVL
jgi:integrase